MRQQQLVQLGAMPMGPDQLLRIGGNAPQGEFVLAARVRLGQLNAIADELSPQAGLAVGLCEPGQYGHAFLLGRSQAPFPGTMAAGTDQRRGTGPRVVLREAPFLALLVRQRTRRLLQLRFHQWQLTGQGVTGR